MSYSRGRIMWLLRNPPVLPAMDATITPAEQAIVDDLIALFEEARENLHQRGCECPHCEIMERIENAKNEDFESLLNKVRVPTKSS